MENKRPSVRFPPWVLLTACAGFALLAPYPVIQAGDPTSDSGCRIKIDSWTGSYYRKIESPPRFQGFTGVAILPAFTTDPARYCRSDLWNSKLKRPWAGPMETTSVYIGASNPDTGGEIDAGLAYDQVKDNQGNLVLARNPEPASSRFPWTWYRLSRGPNHTLTDPWGRVLARGWTAVRQTLAWQTRLGQKLDFVYAYRPFLRVSGLGGSTWCSESPFTFLPGERVRISLRKKKTKEGWGFLFEVGEGARYYQREFTTSGFSFRNGSGYAFKRINSIDQFRPLGNGLMASNEGSGVKVIPTRARALRTGWEEAYLIKADGTKVPFVANNGAMNVRGQDTAPYYNATFSHRSGIDARGGEILDITPQHPTRE